MAGELVERFTPGGNVYPDGSSKFEMLVAFFRRLAENRDNVDRVISQTAASDAVEQVRPNTLQPADDPDVVFGVVDEDGRRLWLEAGRDGGPTQHAADKIAPIVAPAAAAAVGISDQNSDVTGLSFAITDDEGRRLWLEAGRDGGPSERVIDMLAQRLGVGPATHYQATYDDTVHPVVSGPDIVCWGDSMTAGTGGGGTTYPGVLATLTGHTVHNRGVGGETSVTIAARSGANPLLVLPEGEEIPASGAVNLILQPVNGHTPAPLIQGTAEYREGTLAGIPGVITRYSSGIYTFNRAAAGTAVAVTRPIPWLSTEAISRRGDIAIIWIGQNGPSHARAKADVAAIIRHLSALDKRYIVIPKPTSTAAEDAEWHDLYGRRVLPIRQYLVNYGLADAGIIPTAQDETDMAAGRVPASLRVDDVHFNTSGYTILANQLNNRLREMGWV